MTFRRFAMLASLAAVLAATKAHAFVHIVRPGETLSQISTRVYGDARLELVIADANALDVQGGSGIVPGMRLEIPACSFHRVLERETWPSLAREYLGDSGRADELALINGGLAWIAPSPEQEVKLPYVLTHIAAEGDTTTKLAHRYLGDANFGWKIDAFNGRKEWKLVRGDVVLVPLAALDLTEAGKAEAAQAQTRDRSQAAGASLELQRKVDAELPPLLADVRAGRYVEAVGRGSRLLGLGELSRVQLATIYRALLEAYVALEAHGSAAAACADWMKNEPHPVLDPMLVSPKIRAACAGH
ncbi:MAG TPA: LysM domain-containing protein [Polyangiaceae bacterium]